MNRLIRISFGPFQLLDLEPGEVEPVKRRVLREQLGAAHRRRARARRTRRTTARAQRKAHRAKRKGWA